MLELIEELKREILVMVVAAMPISELRGGAIPLGISLGLSPAHSTIISILGNMAIVPILLKILIPIMDYFEKKLYFFCQDHWLGKKKDFEKD